MIISEHTSISSLGQDYSGYTPQSGVKSRVSAIVTENGDPADGILVELLDHSRKVVLARDKTDYLGRVYFDRNTAYEPVIIRPVPPSGKIISPADKKSMTWPLTGSWYYLPDAWTDNWDWGHSEHFAVGSPYDTASPEQKPKAAPGSDEEDGWEKLLTTKNMLMAAGVAIGALVLYNLFTGRVSSD